MKRPRSLRRLLDPQDHGALEDITLRSSAFSARSHLSSSTSSFFRFSGISIVIVDASTVRRSSRRGSPPVTPLTLWRRVSRIRHRCRGCAASVCMCSCLYWATRTGTRRFVGAATSAGTRTGETTSTANGGGGFGGILTVRGSCSRRCFAVPTLWLPLGQGHRWGSFSECLAVHTEDPAEGPHTPGATPLALKPHHATGRLHRERAAVEARAG
jgi:hypothetical protein